MMPGTPQSPRTLIRRLLPLLAVPLALWIGACQKMAPSAPPPPPGDPAPFADLRVVNDAPFPDMFFRSFGVNPTIDTAEERFSTFSVDVDTASYSVTRAYLERGELPPPEAIRVEEFVNSFDYGYETPPRDERFALAAEAFPSPWRTGYHVLHLGLQAWAPAPQERPPTLLVFVVDVSGSMEMENRLGLVRRSLRLLVDALRPDDRVGLVVYGDRGRVILEPRPVGDRGRILAAIGHLAPGGSTNAQEGIELGYRMAARHRIPGGVNRVVLCSDGVANNGISTSADGIFATVRSEAAEGISISTVGFGMGNYNDVLMERLAQVGDGNYHYVDDLAEARRVFVHGLSATLWTVARDVKIQLELDPASVLRYRLLGYENRRLETEDFADDAKDAGEVGAGHAVTALYEVKLVPDGGALGWARVRSQPPEGGPSTLIERRLDRTIVRGALADASPPARLSLAAAAFAEKLRGSYWVRQVGWDRVAALHRSVGPALAGREEVRELGLLIDRAAALDARADPWADLVPPGEMDFDRVPILRSGRNGTGG